MKQISGFTFIKNGLKLNYPVLESIKSITPLCDEIVINVCFDDPDLQRDDGTYQFLRDNLSSKKYKFLKSFWDQNITDKGQILAIQTNRALNQCKSKYVQYIQADEIIHEEDLPLWEDKIKKIEKNDKIEGLLFPFIHFYANTNIIKKTRNVYRREIRFFKNHLGLQSWLDAQGFKHKNLTKIKCIQTEARIFHYGWARKEVVMSKKALLMDRLYHGRDYLPNEKFQYKKEWGLKEFQGHHPLVMADWIKKNYNNIALSDLKEKFRFKYLAQAISDFVEEYTDYRLGEYKNYILL